MATHPKQQAVVDTSALGPRRKARPYPKGRPIDPHAAEEIRALLGDSPRRRDLLVEFLHRVQDRYGYISAAHVAALADEMRLAQTEVYEVATFYHHFDVIKEGETPPPPLTVRVCETLSCQLAGAVALREACERAGWRGVRVIGAPCIGRCEHAPAAIVGRNSVDRATVAAIAEAVADGRVDPPLPSAIDYAAYRVSGGYQLLGACVRGEHTVDSVIAALEESGLRGLGGAGFSAGRKWTIVRAEPAHGATPGWLIRGRRWRRLSSGTCQNRFS